MNTPGGEVAGQAELRTSRVRAHSSQGEPPTTSTAGTAERGTAATPVSAPATPAGPNPRRDPGRTAVEISHLRKTYGSLTAVDDISLTVAEGEIFGILGPNGAGKTTTVECAIGLRVPDSGTVRLMGLDPQADKAAVHQLTGVQLQDSAFPAKLRIGEILAEFRSFYRQPADVSELVEALGLAGKQRDYYRTLSGGQRQRLSVVLALIGQPRIAVLDEMTTGLDPQARRDTWQLIERIRDRGTTIVLVTHFMEEAERLCDRVALVDAGRVVALDSPAGLAARASGGTTVRFRPSTPFDDQLLTALPDVTLVKRDGHQVVVTGSSDLITAVILALHAAGVQAKDVQIDASNLEDAFVRLTGQHPDAEGTQS